MSNSFLVKLTPYDVPNNLYVATVMDPGAHPEHPIFYPPGIWGPTDPRPGWGLPEPQPPTGQPPGIWGPGDPRPQPPIAFPPGWVGGVPPEGETPPPDPSTPVSKGKWAYGTVNGETGWFFLGVSGPYDKPKPQ